jgi:hypothetical protein
VATAGTCATCLFFKRRWRDGTGTCWHVDKAGSATHVDLGCEAWRDRLANRVMVEAKAGGNP